MGRIEYPVGDDRNKDESSERYTFHICPKPCKKGDVKREDICRGGVESSDSTNAEITEWTVFSQNGDFLYQNYLDLDPMCDSGIYTIQFVTNILFTVQAPFPVTNVVCYKGKDVDVYIVDRPYTPKKIMTINAAGWQGTWVAGDRIVFQVRKNDPGMYEKMTLRFDLCPKRVGVGPSSSTELSKCGGEEQYRYTFCICPTWKTEEEGKCNCNYKINDLHWYILGSQDDEEFVCTWINPETCCTNWIRLSTMFWSTSFIEFCGEPQSEWMSEILRSKPNTPAKVYPDDSDKWNNFVWWQFEGNNGWVCDRLHWSLAYNRYGVWTHGINVQGVPGELAMVDGWIVDEQCSNPVVLSSIYFETVGLIGGSIVQIWDYSKREFIVNVKGSNVKIKSSDYTRYRVGDWVAIQKIGAKPPVGYPSITRWIDNEGDWHDPIPYITDQNVPKVEPDGRIVIFTSLNLLPTGFYGSDFIGDPLLSSVPKSELINGTVKIIAGKLNGTTRLITDVIDGNKLRVLPWPSMPDAGSKFEVVSPNITETDNLRIVPYDFKYGPSYTYTE